MIGPPGPGLAARGHAGARERGQVIAQLVRAGLARTQSPAAEKPSEVVEVALIGIARVARGVAFGHQHFEEAFDERIAASRRFHANDP